MDTSKAEPTPVPTLRPPTATDAEAVHDLIARCPPLDRNSLYCNLLHCSHFAATSAIAVAPDGAVLGFVSGYLLPGHDTVLFIWQVAVDAPARGQRLGQRLIEHILARPVCASVRFLHTTVTRSNQPSRAMFARLARRLGATVRTTVKFDREIHFGGRNESEELLAIGPLLHTRIHEENTSHHA